MRPIHIIGVPLDLGGGRRGVDMGPSAFRIAGLSERMTTLGCRVVDRGDLEVPIPEMRHPGADNKRYVDDIAAVIERAIQLAGDGTAGLHVSFDLDVCDPSIAPGVGTPVKGGLDYREAHMVMEVLADSGRLIGLDMVEVNPTLDVRNSTAELGTELVLSALGMKIL